MSYHVPKRVLFVIDQLECGGAQQLLASFSASLIRRGCDVTICSLQPGNELARRMTSAGARVVTLERPRPSILAPWRLLRYAWGIVQELKRLSGPGCVISAHLSDAEFLGILAGLLQKDVRIQATIHTPRLLPRRSRIDPRNALRRFITRSLFNRADWIVGVSQQVTDVLAGAIGVRREKLRVIHNGIDTAAFGIAPPPELREDLGLPPDAFIFSSIARLTAQKHHELAIRALAQLANKGRNAVLLLAGDGELRGMLEKLASDTGMRERVFFAGVRQDVPQLLSLSDCYIIPSLFEGLSLSMLEAMAAGKAIVATDIPGVHEVIVHGQNGLLVPVDDQDAFARAMDAIIEDGELKRTLEHEARATALRNYDIEPMVDAYAALWNTSNR